MIDNKPDTGIDFFDLSDLSDLPDELLHQLRPATNIDMIEEQIIAVMQGYQGEIILDQVIVGLYRKFKIVLERRFLQNKLYRMLKKGLICAGGKRGAYRLAPRSGAGSVI